LVHLRNVETVVSRPVLKLDGNAETVGRSTQDRPPRKTPVRKPPQVRGPLGGERYLSMATNDPRIRE
jgi:hypothetical protein